MGAGAGHIGVLVAEDNRDLSDAICALIATEPDMQVTATVNRVSHLLDAAAKGDSTVLVLDLDLGGESSVAALRALLGANAGLAVVIYSGYERGDLGLVLEGNRRCQYLTKSGDASELLAAIRRAADAMAVRT